MSVSRTISEIFSVK